jgi:hypothetical protein
MSHDTDALDALQTETTCDEYEPTEADIQDYIAWSAERDRRLWEERIAAAPTFIETLYAEANRYLDMDDPTMRWLGGQIAKLADQARYLEAKSGEAFDDRKQAMLDAIECNR